MSTNKRISVNTEEVDRMMDKLMDEIEIDLSRNDGNPPLDGQRNAWSESSRRLLRFALILVVLALLIVAAGYSVQSVSEETLAVEEMASAPIPVSVESPMINNVPPTIQPEVAVQTASVPVLVSSADASIVETESATASEPAESTPVSILRPETVNQTEVELTVIDVPEGVTENQFAGMEQTSPQPQPELTTTVQPSIEHSVTVSAPPTPASSYTSDTLQAPIPSFEGVVQSYLPVTVPILKQASWWQQLLFGLSPSSYVSGGTTFARGDVQYFIELGSKSVHGETINLALVVPQVDEVQDARTDDKTPLNEEEIQSLLIRDACLNVENLRSVMNQAKAELTAEAGGYELLLSWYTHRGDHVAQNISDAELISYCQLG